jgi:hypothetical protein
VKKHYSKLSLAIFTVIALLMVAGTAVLAHREGANDPLSRLKQALAAAGAPALTSDQEQQITALLTAWKATAANLSTGNLESDEQAFNDAILNVDANTALSEADVIGTDVAAGTTARLKAVAVFEISILNMLKADSNQVALLVNRFGTTGLSRLLNSFAESGLHGHPDADGN